ncbi:hypothetical protein FBALC1_09607 [Flavobacteriales bacterium ALC-1]|nr:hypothetical protein FBALC1_09607 [Flavobacteriales bacterium ALC-1]
MEEFFKDYYTLITYSVEFIAAITGIIFYRKYKNTFAKYFIYFLVYAFFVDLLGNYPRYLYNMDLFHLIKGTLIEENYWWFTIFWWIGLSSFMAFLNYKFIEKTMYKRVLKLFYYIYILQAIIYGILNFKQLFEPTVTFIVIVSVWMISVTVVLYFLEILQSNRIIDFYKSIYFYINTSVLMWTIVVTPVAFYEIYFDSADWNYVILKWQIFLSVNIIFYLTLTLALIFCKPETK